MSIYESSTQIKGLFCFAVIRGKMLKLFVVPGAVAANAHLVGGEIAPLSKASE
jgi:hypothetical protein